MTKLNRERKGPPRPASGSMDHPRAIERPCAHVTDADKRRREAEPAKERRELEDRSWLHDIEQMAARSEARIWRKQAVGIPLAAWDRFFLKFRGKPE